MTQPTEPADGGIIRHRNPGTQAGFTIVPNAILTAAELSTGARILYALLKMHAWQSDSAYPGQTRLAGYIGVSTRQLRTYQLELETAKLITVEQRGLRQTNLYWIEEIPVYFLSDRKHTSDQDRKHTSDKEYSGIKNTQIEEYHPSSVSTLDGASADNAGFDQCWHAYPKRNGKRLEKQRALSAYNRLSQADRAALPAAIANYSASDQIPRDMFRFLARDYWREWLTPASAPPARRAGAPVAVQPAKYLTGKYAHLFNQEQAG